MVLNPNDEVLEPTPQAQPAPTNQPPPPPAGVSGGRDVGLVPQQPPPVEPPSQDTALNDWAMQGLSFGYADEGEAALQAALKDRQPGETFDQAYDRHVAKVRERLKAGGEAYPGSTTAAQVFGGGLTTVLPGGGQSRLASTGAGAVQGAVEGWGEGEGVVDSARKAAIQGVGGAVGGFISPTLAKPLAALAQRLTSKIGFMEALGALKTAETMLASGRSIDEIENIIVEGQKRGQPAALVDVGKEPAARATTKAMIDNPDADAAARLAFEGRDAEKTGRVQGFLTNLPGGGATTEAERRALQVRARGANKPLYDAAYAAHPTLTSPELDRIVGSDAMQTAIGDLEKKASNRSVAQGGTAVKNPFIKDPATGRYVIDPNAPPSLEAWDQLQRNVRDQAEGAPGGGLGQKLGSEGTDIANVRRSLNEELDKAAPQFKAARGKAAEFFGEGDALDWGKKLASSTYDAENFQKALGAIDAMNPAEKRLAQASYLDSLVHRTGENTQTGANITQRILGSDNDKLVVEKLFGPKVAERVNDFVNVEGLMQASKVRASSGSQTAQRQADLDSKVNPAGRTLLGTGAATTATGAAMGNTALMAGGATGMASGAAMIAFDTIKDELKQPVAAQVVRYMFSPNAADRQTVYKMMERSPEIRSAVSRAAAKIGALGADVGVGGFLGGEQQ